MNGQIKKAAALAAVLTGMLATSAALGQDPGPCYRAYLESGLTEQQMTFDHFHRFYSDTLCATDDDSLTATHGVRVSGGTR
jgi:hypothetical protein